jgi:holin-like protein
MRGWLVILGFYGCGTALHEWARVPLPGSLIGMLLLTVALGTGWIRLELVEGAS